MWLAMRCYSAQNLCYDMNMKEKGPDQMSVEGLATIGSLKMALQRYKSQWMVQPSRELEAEIARIEWLLAQVTGRLN